MTLRFICKQVDGGPAANVSGAPAKVTHHTFTLEQAEFMLRWLAEVGTPEASYIDRWIEAVEVVPGKPE